MQVRAIAQQVRVLRLWGRRLCKVREQVVCDAKVVDQTGERFALRGLTRTMRRGCLVVFMYEP